MTAKIELKVVTAPFDPAKFVGRRWAFWKGPKDGNGLEGEEERDKASLALTEVDFGRMDLLTCLENGESSITGKEKLARLKKSGRTLYGATIFAGLWQDYRTQMQKENSVLESLYRDKSITYVDFFGDILRAPHGDRCVLYFYRRTNGQWRWGAYWLGAAWRALFFSAISQQVSS